jgi:hypothetical protein
LGEFKKRFNPDYSLVVGSGGVPLEEFFSWDLERLIEIDSIGINVPLVSETNVPPSTE